MKAIPAVLIACWASAAPAAAWAAKPGPNVLLIIFGKGTPPLFWALFEKKRPEITAWAPHLQQWEK